MSNKHYKETARKYYLKNKKRILAQQKKHYYKNIEKNRKKGRQYYHKNKERMLKYGKEWKRKNPEKRREQARKWYEKNRERVRKYVREYRKNRKAQVSQWLINTRIKKIELLGKKCEKCGNTDKRVLVFHHKKYTRRERSISFEMIEKERENIMLVCANCHMIIHYHNKQDKK